MRRKLFDLGEIKKTRSLDFHDRRGPFLCIFDHCCFCDKCTFCRRRPVYLFVYFVLCFIVIFSKGRKGAMGNPGTYGSVGERVNIAAVFFVK